MSHAYPLAQNAADALAMTGSSARTRYEAERLADDLQVVRLETEWITPPQEGDDTLIAAADAGRSAGFVQLYENADGSPVLAVTYWKLEVSGTIASKRHASAGPSRFDDTDDLYFRHGRTKPRRKRKIDPAQLDLFTSPSTSNEEEV